MTTKRRLGKATTAGPVAGSGAGFHARSERLAAAASVSRFVGNDPQRWRSDVPAVDRVLLGDAWPGIAVELVAHGRNVEKLFTVAPGADARRIAIRVGGAKRLELAADGALVAHTGNGPVAFSAPVAWQDIDGQRRPVDVKYALAGKRYGFSLGEHDRAHAVVIDPVLAQTYLGGAANDFLWGIVPDGGGSLYVVGYTSSANFPGTAGGSQPAQSGAARDTFVAKLDRDLNLQQATYFGGSGDDFGFAIALSSAGHVIVSGYTASSNLPGTAGGAQANTAGGGADGFIAKFSADLKTLMQATYTGGTGFDTLVGMAIDANDNVFVLGATNSTNYPGTAGSAQPAYGGGGADAVVAKFSADLKTRLQSTFIGGTAVDQGYSIAIVPAGDVYISGSTASLNFPVTAGAAQTVYGGGSTDGFVARLSNDLKTRHRATYVGGSGQEIAWAVAVGATGSVYTAGGTDSTNFPWVAGAPQPTNGGGTDAFFAQFDAELAGPGRATYIGGTGFDEAHALAIDPLTGRVAVVGQTGSSGLARPASAGRSASGKRAGAATAAPGQVRSVEADAQGDELAGADDGFVAVLDLLAELFFYAVFYVGGVDIDHAYAIAYEAASLYLAGSSKSPDFEPDAVMSPGAASLKARDDAAIKSKATPKLQPTNAGAFDGFVVRYVAPSTQGLWWNPLESGWGINFAHQGDIIFATWFTFGPDNKPQWYTIRLDRTSGGVYAGPVRSFTGPPFNSEPFPPNVNVPTPVGTATVTFAADGSSATFNYTVNGITQTKQIERQQFVPAVALPACVWGGQSDLTLTVNYQDLWWVTNGAESGWGINFTHQGKVIFATWFTYDLNGNGWWLFSVATETAVPGVYTGTVRTATGPAFSAEPWNPNAVVRSTVGNTTITITDGNHAKFDYTVNGVTQSKNLVRQVFVSPGTACQ